MRLARMLSSMVLGGAVLLHTGAAHAEVPTDQLPDILLGTPTHSAAAYELVVGEFNGQPGQDIAAAVFVDLKTLDGAVQVIPGDPAGWGQGHTLNAGNVTQPIGPMRAIGAAMAAGQLDSDPLQDLLVGDPYWDGERGRVLLLTGRADLDEWAAEVGSDTAPSFLGAGPEDFLGTAVASGIDVTGDGFEDVLVCASGADNEGGASVGAFYVWDGVDPGQWNGMTRTTDEAWVTLHGESAWLSPSTLCWSLEVGLDYDGDGYQDLLMGDPYYNWGQGIVYVVSGNFANVQDTGHIGTQAHLSILGSANSYNFGSAVAAVDGLDVHGESWSIAVGNPSWNGERGAVYLFTPNSFPPDLNLDTNDAAQTFEGPIAETFVGTALQGTQGMGGQSGQLWVGAGGLGGLEHYAGAMGLVTDQAIKAVPAVASFDDIIGLVQGTAEEGYLGSTIGAGDVDGDGRMDVVTADYGGTAGRIYVLRGALFGDQDGDGWVGLLEDCADEWIDVYPGADEICDGHPDNNCDDVEDPHDLDGDQDGVTPCAGDCDDGEPSVHEGAPEICDDGLDNDCDELTDGDDPDCAGDDDVGDDDGGDDDGGDDDAVDDDDHASGFRCDCQVGGRGATPAALGALALLGLLGWRRWEREASR